MKPLSYSLIFILLMAFGCSQGPSQEDCCDACQDETTEITTSLVGKCKTDAENYLILKQLVKENVATQIQSPIGMGGTPICGLLMKELHYVNLPRGVFSEYEDIVLRDTMMTPQPDDDQIELWVYMPGNLDSATVQIIPSNGACRTVDSLDVTLEAQPLPTPRQNTTGLLIGLGGRAADVAGSGLSGIIFRYTESGDDKKSVKTFQGSIVKKF